MSSFNIKLLSDSVLHFQPQILPALSALQKKVALIALAIFSALAALYAFYYFYSKKTLSKGEILDESALVNLDEIWPEAIEEIKAEGLELKEENILQKVADKLEQKYQTTQQRAFLIASLQVDIQRLANYAEVTFHNCASFEEAQVLLIGEDHTIKRHRDLWAFLVARFAKENPVIAFEGSTFKEERRKYSYHCICWDHDDTYQKHVKVLKTLYETRGQLSQEEYIALCTLEKTCMQQRNQTLMQSIATHLSQFPENQFFARAGRLHLTDDRENYHILEGLPQDGKYAFVICKETEEERKTGRQRGEEHLKNLLARHFS